MSKADIHLLMLCCETGGATYYDSKYMLVTFYIQQGISMNLSHESKLSSFWQSANSSKTMKMVDRNKFKQI